MPKISELKITYMIGVKANIGNYESADSHISRGETWDMDNESLEDANTFYTERLNAMRDELGTRVELEYKELKG